MDQAVESKWSKRTGKAPPDKGIFNRMGKKVNPSWNWPREPLDTWDMSRDDPDRDLDVEDEDESIPVIRSRTIVCRLLQSKYTKAQAHARCQEIHGTCFDGVFRAGRYWVFWRWNK